MGIPSDFFIAARLENLHKYDNDADSNEKNREISERKRILDLYSSLTFNENKMINNEQFIKEYSKWKSNKEKEQYKIKFKNNATKRNIFISLFSFFTLRKRIKKELKELKVYEQNYRESIYNYSSKGDEINANICNELMYKIKEQIDLLEKLLFNII